MRKEESFANEGTCLTCEKEFTNGWNDFFCTQDHAIRYRYTAEEENNS